MRSTAELKQIFQAGWNIPARVENYVRHAAEFTEGESHVAWRRALDEALSTSGRLKILDVGTGPAFFACLYSHMGHECTGLDFSERMHGVARQRAAGLNVDTKFVFGDAEEPPYADATFDAVSSRHVLFNLPRPGVAVREWVRVLKPGGRLILIGNEHDAESSVSLMGRGRQLVRRWLGRGRRRGVPGWKPAPGYREAVGECPLFRHGSGALRAVMEAAGLEDIHTVATDDVQRARRSGPRRNGHPFGPSRFFILVGLKPPERRHTDNIVSVS